ncbi:MAG: hypothetical protein AB7T37_11175 [Dehalococcoidia bacterium]
MAQHEPIEGYVTLAREARDADPRFWIAAGVGGLAAVWLTVKLIKIVARAAGFLTTAATLVGIVLYIRERLTEQDESQD